MTKKSFAVLGLGKFGKSVAIELSNAGAEVLAVDENEELVQEIAPFVECAMKGDVCDISVLSELGLSNMDAVVVATSGSLDASVTATIFAKEEGVPVIVAKAQNEIQSRILKKVGADRVLIPEHESGVRVARSLFSEYFIDFIELSDRLRLIEAALKPEWAGKTLAELNLRKKHNINVVGIRENGNLKVNVDPDRPLPPGCSLLLIADRRELAHLS